ncbi:hypothetical protein [Kitasatospora paranensis]|uniref:Muconolactone isomerase domain-containing protein n=1 Tax=Kitasatospora paranensis TaxID=258053 RepID=A0ABW2G8T6_9ACTN
MRMLIQASIDTEISNKLIAEGGMAAAMDEVMALLKPEAAYFYPLHGRRGFTLVVDVTDEPSLVAVVEPLWLRMGADVEVVPCMNADDLRAGIARIPGAG